MYKRIMIVVDETEVSDAAVTEGVRLARRHSSHVIFIHVVSAYVMPLTDIEGAAYVAFEKFEAQSKAESQGLLKRALGAAHRAGVASSSCAVSSQDKADCIGENAVKQRCDLIVIGSHGRTTVQRLLQGSVVMNLITISPLPVLVCKRRTGVPSKIGALPVAGAKKARARRRVAA